MSSDEFVWDATSDLASEYDPSKFYCGVTDKNGHYATITLKCPPNIVSVFETLFDSKLFPEARHRQDFGRALMIHGLHHLTSQIKDVSLAAFLRSEVANWIAQEELDRIILRQATDKSTFDKAKKVLKYINGSNKATNIRAAKVALGTIADDDIRLNLEREIARYE